MIKVRSSSGSVVDLGKFLKNLGVFCNKVPRDMVRTKLSYSLSVHEPDVSLLLSTFVLVLGQVLAH